MIKFSNYGIKSAQNLIKLSCDARLELNDPNEDYRSGTPACWDKTFLSRRALNEYSVFHICSAVLPNGQYNSVTDHKKVWGLNSLTPGISEYSYFLDQGKVYLGITEGKGKKEFLNDTSSLLILLPNSHLLSAPRIFQLFFDRKIGFVSSVDMETLLELFELDMESIILYYKTKNETSLTVLGMDVDALFSKNDLQIWENSESLAIYRRYI